MAPEDRTDLDKVTPLQAWFARVGIPERTGHRLIKNGQGPVLTSLTERRKGIRERDHLAWLEARRCTA
jgi:hypothetical protein